MNKIEAIKMAKQIKSECYSRESCEGCPFYCDKSCIYTCLLRYVSNDGFNEKFFDELLAEAKKEERGNLKNVTEIHVSTGISDEVIGKYLKASLAANSKTLEPLPEQDNINHPKHYCKSGLECIDVIRAAVSNLPPFEAVCVANIIKYAWRYKEKNGLEDVMKAAKYLEWLQEEVEKNANKA